jgi:hypothetical protein
MKSWQISLLCLSLLLLVPLVVWITYSLWAFSPKLALTLEFASLGIYLLIWFTLFDRIISRV